MIGGAREKIQTIVELAEAVYERVNEVDDRLRGVSDTVEDTNERVRDLEDELRAHRRVLEAIAEDHDLDLSADDRE